MHFQGARIDLASFQSTSSSPIHIALDGKLPSTVLGTVQFGRTSYCFQKSCPAIQRIEFLVPLEPEDWTLTITQIQTNAASFHFRIEGSKTGPDGEGSNQANFISKSRRVFIRPQNWLIPIAAQQTGAVPPEVFKLSGKPPSQAVIRCPSSRTSQLTSQVQSHWPPVSTMDRITCWPHLQAVRLHLRVNS